MSLRAKGNCILDVAVCCPVRISNILVGPPSGTVVAISSSLVVVAFDALQLMFISSQGMRVYKGYILTYLELSLSSSCPGELN